MNRIDAKHVPEVDAIRIDLPASGYRVSVLLQPDEATRLATALKVALAARAKKAKS